MFLPFSSWLVSITGDPKLSLIRDGLIILLFLLSLVRLDWNLQHVRRLIFPGVFLLYGLLTFFWREASELQWLRGIRFVLGPILLYFSLLNFDFKKSEKRLIYRYVLTGVAIISVVSILEFFGIKIPVTSKYSEDGSLSDIHRVGTLEIVRLKSILAGPNGLGLYLLAAIGFSLGAFKKISPKLYLLAVIPVLLLLLTYSRSAFLGFLAMLLVALGFYIKKKTDLKVALSVIALILSSFFCLLAVLYIFPRTQEFLTHNDSSKIRFQEYTRIWQTKGEIGLLGRGPGTAGPSSQNRLDYGPNHYTENIYLDIFEEFGYIGLALYLALLLFSLFKILKHAGGVENYTAFLLFVAFGFAGIFINYYTGQVGIFLFWLVSGLVVKDNHGKLTS